MMMMMSTICTGFTVSEIVNIFVKQTLLQLEVWYSIRLAVKTVAVLSLLTSTDSLSTLQDDGTTSHHLTSVNDHNKVCMNRRVCYHSMRLGYLFFTEETHDTLTDFFSHKVTKSGYDRVSNARIINVMYFTLKTRTFYFSLV